MAYIRYRNGYARRASATVANSYVPRMNKSTPKFDYATADGWSAAAAAMRINGVYLKEDSYKYDEATNTSTLDKSANKWLVKKMLEAGNGWTEEDVARGEAARTYWQSMLLKMMTSNANEFEQNAIRIANGERLENNYDVAVLSSLIASAERGMARDVINDVKANLPSKFQGKQGDTLVIKNAEVINVGSITDFGKYRVDVNAEGNLYSWWSSKTYTPGSVISVKGRVKSHYNDRATNTQVTQLNYVKEV